MNTLSLCFNSALIIRFHYFLQTWMRKLLFFGCAGSQIRVFEVVNVRCVFPIFQQALGTLMWNETRQDAQFLTNDYKRRIKIIAAYYSKLEFVFNRGVHCCINSTSSRASYIKIFLVDCTIIQSRNEYKVRAIKWVNKIHLIISKP